MTFRTYNARTSTPAPRAAAPAPAINNSANHERNHSAHGLGFSKGGKGTVLFCPAEQVSAQHSSVHDGPHLSVHDASEGTLGKSVDNKGLVERQWALAGRWPTAEATTALALESMSGLSPRCHQVHPS
jgi:hypothetical protein